MTMLLALAAPFVLVACYSLGAQWLMLHAPHSPATVAFVLGPVVLGVATGLWTSGRRALALLLLAAAGGGLGWLAWRGLPDITPLYVAEYVTVYGAMAWLFWRSLRGTPLITRLARSVHRLTPDMERYTVRLTRAWALYFAGMALLSLLLFDLLPFGWWALYANIGSPLALGAFFLGEHVLRYHWHPEFDRASVWASVQAWRERREPPAAAAAGQEGGLTQPPGSAR